jgi:heat-inducible transcriptional repressor
MELNRRDLILKYIVEHFVKTATPVGSVTLIETYKLSFSSATIRNEMLALEADGLLEKTHTSSGRIPSSKGYRYYVDRLRSHSVDDDIKHQLQAIIQKKSQSINDVIAQSCEILSNMTNLASFVLGPNARLEKLISLQVIPLANHSATAVFVTDQGYVENKTFILPTHIEMQEVQSCVKLLNERLTGTLISGVVEKMEAIKPILHDFIADNDFIYQAFAQAFSTFAHDRLKLYGKNELFAQPEFVNDAQKLRSLLSLLDSPQTIREITNDPEGNVTIKIGEFGQDHSDVSIISTKLHIPGQNEGRIAVVGPTRMDYDKVLSALEYLAEILENAYTKKGKE